MVSFDHVSLVYGVTGQTVEFYPPDAEVVADGAPTAAANYRVLSGTQSNDETAEIALAAATLDSVSTTLSAAAGVSQTNRKSLTLTSGTGVTVRRRYLLTNASGQREVVVVASVSGTAATAERDLAYDYASGATFIGLRHSFTINATFIQTESKINVYASPSFASTVSNITSTLAPPYRVEWQYTTPSSSIARRTWSTFDVVRQKFKINLSIEDVKAQVPDVVWDEWLNQRGQAFEPQLQEATTMVELDLRMAGIDPDAVRDPWALKQMAKAAFWVVMSRTGWHPPDVDPQQYRVDSEDVYAKLFAKLVTATQKIWVDTGTKGSIDPAPFVQPWLLV